MENIKKGKVGIVTFHTGDNFGAVLQAYALQRYLEDNGYSVRIIDFRTPNHEKEHRVFRRMSLTLWKNAVLQFILLCHYIPLRRRINRFKKFRKQYFQLTAHRYVTEEDFLHNMEYFDYYISGSDQVFHPRVKYSDCYYLHFPKNHSRKIAYAPSFGITEFSDDEIERIKKRVSDFDVLCCREKEGADFLSRLLHKKVPVVCDPVFLLKKHDWLEIAKMPIERNPYIFIYALHDPKSLIKMAKQIRATDKRLKIICSTTNLLVFDNQTKMARNLGPCEFLGYLSSAQYVLTDSFHGTVLSLVIGKKVITLNAFKAVLSRIHSIMDRLGTSSQVVEDASHFSFEDTDFNDYTAQMNQFVDCSKEYLSRSLRS